MCWTDARVAVTKRVAVAAALDNGETVSRADLCGVSRQPELSRSRGRG